MIEVKETPIGARILVRATCKPFYDIECHRYLGRKLLPIEKEYFYVGYTFKMEGIYVPESVGSGNYFEPPDYNPAFLSVGKAVKVLRIRKNPRGKEEFCLPEDALLLEEGKNYE